MTNACSDLLIQYEAIRKKLLRSGADLSKIKISMKDGTITKSYITKRIMEGLKGGET